MKIPRITEVGKELFIEGDFFNLLEDNQINYGVEAFDVALKSSYFGTDLSSMTLLEFASAFPYFGNGRYGDSILYAGDSYLIPAEMEDNDSEEAIAFFENLAETIINGN